MAEFFADYGLFLLKTVTVVIAIVAVIVAAAAAQRRVTHEGLEVENLNKKYRGLADALLVTGTGTGAPTPLEDVGRVRTAVPHAPVLVASGVTVDEVRAVLEAADGVVVGSSIMREGRAGQPVDAARARALVEEARS